MQRKKIYCFPNRFGMLGFTLFLVILAAAATYQNNLVFMMGFLCLGFAMVAILQTARNLRAVDFLNIHIEPNYSLQSSVAEIFLKNNSAEPVFNIHVKITWLGQPIEFFISEIHSQSMASCRVDVPLNVPRGLYRLRRVNISTDYPYGLFKAWTYAKHIQSYEILAYPLPFGESLPQMQSATSSSDFAGHRSYEPGDSMNRVDWKVYSRRQELHVKDFESGSESKIKLHWNQLDGQDLEHKLSQMSEWIRQAEQSAIEYEVNFPKITLAAGRGEKHFHRCMCELTRLA